MVNQCQLGAGGDVPAPFLSLTAHMDPTLCVPMESPPSLSAVLPPVALRRLARSWLEEDCPLVDYAGVVAGDRPGEAALLQKSPGVLAGAPFVEAVFAEMGCTVEWHRPEGGAPAPAPPPLRVATVRGRCRHLLLAERAALNCVARASGIASACRRVAGAAERAGWGGRLAGTRKTTPGFRLVEKYAMMVGGVAPHRFHLCCLTMLKDNHVTISGDLGKALEQVRTVAGPWTKVEVEARSLEEAAEAARHGADIVMLDNFPAEEAVGAAEQLKRQFPGLLIEASGGITEETLSRYFSPHIDVISLGCLTQSPCAVDFSLKILQEHEVGNGAEEAAAGGPESRAARRDYAF